MWPCPSHDAKCTCCPHLELKRSKGVTFRGFQHGPVCADTKTLLCTLHVQQSMTSCSAKALLLATCEDMLMCLPCVRLSLHRAGWALHAGHGQEPAHQHERAERVQDVGAERDRPAQCPGSTQFASYHGEVQCQLPPGPLLQQCFKGKAAFTHYPCSNAL